MSAASPRGRILFRPPSVSALLQVTVELVRGCPKGRNPFAPCLYQLHNPRPSTVPNALSYNPKAHQRVLPSRACQHSSKLPGLFDRELVLLAELERESYP